MIPCTVYIDEAGDLGIQRGTQWFVLSAVIVDKSDEPAIRNKINAIRSYLNVNEIHLRKIPDFYKRAFIVHQLSDEPFTYMNILVDTNKFDKKKIPNPLIAYNYVCKYFLQRISWYLEQTDRQGDIILSARGTSRDQELIQYISNKLLPYSSNQINKMVFGKISAKSASEWDMLQLADVCATTMFLSYEENHFGFCTPCFSLVLSPHLYRFRNQILSYGIKFFTKEMEQDKSTLLSKRICTKKERTPSATTT